MRSYATRDLEAACQVTAKLANTPEILYGTITTDNLY